jgi:hypothetical protein
MAVKPISWEARKRGSLKAKRFLRLQPQAQQSSNLPGKVSATQIHGQANLTSHHLVYLVYLVCLVSVLSPFLFASILKRSAPRIPIYRDAPKAQLASRIDFTFKIHADEIFSMKTVVET